MNPLSSAQQQAYSEILTHFHQKNVCLLHGVTASGKTEIYIHLIQQAIQAGKQVLYLLPEIALTTQITERLKRVFGNRLGIYHSKFPDAERVEIWRKQLTDDDYDVILEYVLRFFCLSGVWDWSSWMKNMKIPINSRIKLTLSCAQCSYRTGIDVRSKDTVGYGYTLYRNLL